MEQEEQELLINDIARWMSYAYERGKLDTLGMKDGPEKEQIVRARGDLCAARWIDSVRALFNMRTH